MKTPLEILKGARNILSDPARWCKGVPARLADGTPTSALSPYASQWCMAGALAKSFDHDDFLCPEFDWAARELCRAVWDLTGANGIGDFNDAATHEEMLKFLDEHIAEYENGVQKEEAH